jgi:hypothetical protein
MVEQSSNTKLESQSGSSISQKASKKQKPRPKSEAELTYEYMEIVWDDAASNSATWVHLNDIASTERVITRGWLVQQSDDSLTLASSVSGDDHDIDIVGNTMTIPKGMIVEQRKIRVVNAK